MDTDQLGWIIPLSIFGVIGLVFIIVFGVMIKRWLVKQKVLQTGVPATATIVSIRDTGSRMNDNPVVGMQLQVQPSGGPSFRAEVKETVSMLQIPQFQPGAQLNVKYDPTDLTRVAVVSVIARNSTEAPGGSMINAQQAEQMLALYQKANEQLLQTGQSAPAKVLHYMPMGINVNGNNPVVNLVLEVLPAADSPFTAQANGNVIGETSVYKFQPGQMVTVRYNPADLTEVALERSGL